MCHAQWLKAAYSPYSRTVCALQEKWTFRHSVYEPQMQQMWSRGTSRGDLSNSFKAEIKQQREILRAAVVPTSNSALDPVNTPQLLVQFPPFPAQHVSPLTSHQNRLFSILHHHCSTLYINQTSPFLRAQLQVNPSDLFAVHTSTGKPINPS